MAVKFEYTGKLGSGRTWDLDSTKRVTVELDDNDLNVYELLEEFMNFMKAVGYQFELGDHLDIVNDLPNSSIKSFDVNEFNTSNTGEELMAAPATQSEPPKDPY